MTSRPRTSARGTQRFSPPSRWPGTDRASRRPPRARRVVSRAVKEVSFYLGNTPAVCRASYIDPRVIDRYVGGLTIAARLAELAGPGEEETPSEDALGGRVDRAVLDLLAGDEDSPVIEVIDAATQDRGGLASNKRPQPV